MGKMRNLNLTAFLCTSAFYPHSVVAQIAPQHVSVDEYGFDLLSGSLFDPATEDISIGTGPGRLSYSRNGAYAGYDIGSYFMIPGLPGSYEYIVNLGKTSVTFRYSEVNGAVVYTDTSGRGYVSNIAGIFTVTDPDGVAYEFGVSSGSPDENDVVAYLTKIRRPDGVQLKVNYQQYSYTYNNGLISYEDFYTRVQSVENNFGYMLKLDYQTDLEPGLAQGWEVLTSVTAFNRAMDYCDPLANDCNLTPENGAKVTYSRPNNETLVVSGPGDRVRMYSRSYSGSQASTYTISGDSSENAQLTTSGLTKTLEKDGMSTTYTTSTSPYNVITRTDSSGSVTQYTLGLDSASYPRVDSVKDSLNRTKSFQYDSQNRITRITYPEGNYTQFTYDARGNVTEERRVSKTPGSPVDIVLTAGYDATCLNAAKCNKPNWTKDALGNRTDYTYDTTHGGLLTVTAPAAAVGQPRLQKRHTYTQKQAYFKNASGQIVASGEPVSLLSSTAACANATSCTGSAEELKTLIDYGPQSAGIANNLLPISQTVASGDSQIVQTTSIAYDNIGNPVSIDGPLMGNADTTRIRYDARRHVTGTIGPDPDGSGVRINSAMRATYDNQGKVTRVESGTTNGQSEAAWSAFAPADSTEITYDSSGRVKARALKSGANTYALAQTSYDAGGRIDCQAVRMNPATFATLPSTACTQTSGGTFGPDRITKYTYNGVNETTQITKGFGTAEASTEASISYTSNGLISSLVDAENNRTTYIYDGHDRLTHIQFPFDIKGINSSNSVDYIQLSYDLNSNIKQKRLRNGDIIEYNYDNRNQIIFKNTPNAVHFDYDITYQYDLFGRLKSATTTAGHSNNFSYDALGRMTVQKMHNTTTFHAYDVMGRRTRMTWADGNYIAYDYDQIGAVTAIRENGATSGIGLLASYGYDSLGRRTSLSRGNGAVTNYGYDPVSRLSSLSQNLSGSANDLNLTFSYNPAAQIVAVTSSNNGYSWSGSYNINRVSSANGLNQIKPATPGPGQVSVLPLNYDANGNLSQSGSATYQYTAENRLATAPIGNFIGYEPSGNQILQYLNSGSGADTRFGWSGDQINTEFAADAGGAILRRYVPGPNPDETIVWYEGVDLNDRRWLHADERGSVIAVTNSSGDAIAINRYDEFGIPAYSNIGRFQYTGQAWLPEVGMYYYKARIYSPTLGRFMQPDPTGYDDGINWYNYVGADPINATDPSGLKLVYVCVGAEGYPNCGLKDDGSFNWFRDWITSLGFGVTYQDRDDQRDRDFAEAEKKERPNPLRAKVSPQSGANNPCNSLWHKSGDALEAGGKGVTYAGLAIATLGAFGGPEGAVPGIAIADYGGKVSAGGQVLQDIAFDRPIGETLARGAANLFGARLINNVVPKSVRNGLGDALYQQAVSESASALFEWLDPNRCPAK